MQALELKKLPCVMLSADGAVTGWNAEWESALGHGDWSQLRAPVDALMGPEGPIADDAELALDPVAQGSRRVLFQPLHGADGVLSEWLAYLLPVPSERGDREVVAELPLRTLMGLGSNHFLVCDEAGRLVLWNRSVEAVSGRTHDDLVDLPFASLFEPGEQKLVEERVRQVLQGDEEIHLEANLRAGESHAIPYLFWGRRFKCEGKVYMVTIGLDISQRRRDEQTLRLRERALHATTNGIVITRCGGVDNPIEYVNPAFEAITGYNADECMGRDSRFMAAPGMDEAERAELREAIRERRQFSVVFRNRRRNGEIFWNELHVTPVTNERGLVSHFVGVVNDVTARMQRTSHLEHEVTHDTLTGLANRTLLWDRLEQALSVAQRNKSLVATLLVDLNKFKQINDTLGHEAGDEVLKVVARRLQSSVRESDTVARLSGDEFVLVLANQPSLRFTLRMVQRIRADMAKPVMFDSREINVAGSIGVSVYPHDGLTAFDLVRAADTAMYHAKSAGGKDVHFFSPAMKSTTEEKQKLETEMRHAIEHDQFFLMYQPRICLRTGNIIGVEALLRWRHPEKGVLLPGAFLNEAEENGLIVPLGHWVMEKSCRALQRLKLLGLPALTVCMKVGYRELIEENFMALIGERLRANGVEAGRFGLDVRECHLIRNPPLGKELARACVSLGVALGVDDVGDGESNLSYLHHLECKYLKMSNTAVKEISAITGRGPLAKSIIDVGHNLDFKVIAKGVETPFQRDFLAAQGCDELQGHFFSAPVTQEVLERMLGATVS
ncbi:MAG: putative bifunctional diguanylate cyclase/phosphodiesterase [Massilia sp.]